MHDISAALSALKNGGMLIVTDDEGRENEGDLICAAQTITPAQINFMASYGKGLVCLAITQEQGNRLSLPLMQRTKDGGDHFKTAFTYSIDAKEGVTTGISAFDRAKTIALACDPKAEPRDFVTPGHVFPLLARKGGVLERRGHTEAAVDLARLAGYHPSGVICEIMNPDGTMMRTPELEVFSKQHDIPMIHIEQLVEYRLTHEVKLMVETTLPTKWGEFQMRLYHDAFDQEHVVLFKGDLTHDKEPIVRIHSECLTGDIFGSLRCDCGPQLQKTFELIEQEGKGVLIYLRQEGRGIGLTQKLKAYNLQDTGLDTVDANIALGFHPDSRRYDVVGKAVRDLKLSCARLLTNNPAKFAYAQQHIPNCKRVSLIVPACPQNENYLVTKAQKMGHLLQNPLS